jgi:hypothetical protein
MSCFAIPSQESQGMEGKPRSDHEGPDFGEDFFQKEDIPQVRQGSHKIKKGGKMEEKNVHRGPRTKEVFFPS